MSIGHPANVHHPPAVRSGTGCTTCLLWVRKSRDCPPNLTSQVSKGYCWFVSSSVRCFSCRVHSWMNLSSILSVLESSVNSCRNDCCFAVTEESSKIPVPLGSNRGILVALSDAHRFPLTTYGHPTGDHSGTVHQDIHLQPLDVVF